MENQSEALLEYDGMTEPIDWDLVFTSQLPRVYNFFLYKVGQRELAQDLAAATFERAWKLRTRYQADRAALPTWIFGIARNVLKEQLRKNRTGEQKLTAIAARERLSAPVDIENMVQQEQDKQRLRAILLELPDCEQDLIALKYGAGLTNREIAKVTHLSESNVGSILHRTVKYIRAQWEG